MKKSIINTFVFLIVSVVCVSTAQAQQTRVALKGDAYLLKNGKHAALEVGGKIVIGFDEEFNDITTPDGKYFIADYDGKDFYLYDRNGKEVELGDELAYTYDKLSIVDGTIVATRKGETRYFSAADPSKEIKAQQVGADFFENEYASRGKKQYMDNIVKRAKEISDAVAPERQFEIRNNANYTRQQIVYNGQVRFECPQIMGVEKEPVPDNSKTGWIRFNIKGENGRIGIVLLQVYEKNGQLQFWVGQTIPCRYVSIGQDGVRQMVLVCRESHDGNINDGVLVDWVGYEMKKESRSAPPKRTGRRWVCVDKEADLWEIRD